MDVRKEVQEIWKSWRPRDRRVLRAYAKGSPDARFRLRCLIIVNLVQGTKLKQIQTVLGCARATLYRVAHGFLEGGLTGLVDRREDNGQPKISEAYEWALLIAVAFTPRDYAQERPTWTQELLILVVGKQTGIQISTSTMSRTLRRLKVRLGRPKPVVACPWKKARKTRRLNEIRRLIENLPAGHVVVYADEVDIHLNPKIGADWMLQGMQKRVLTPGRNEKRYLAGALNAQSGRLTYVEGERKNSDLFIRQLWSLVRDDYPDAVCIHVILDNYRIHKSKRTQLALQALGTRVRLHFLPPYCPDHNKIERSWKDLHDNVTRNHQCHNMNELMREVRKYLRKHQRELLAQYAAQAA